MAKRRAGDQKAKCSVSFRKASKKSPIEGFVSFHFAYIRFDKIHVAEAGLGETTSSQADGARIALHTDLELSSQFI